MVESRQAKNLLKQFKQGLDINSNPNEELESLYFLNVLVFSKDRPFQLQQFLRSFLKCCLKQMQITSDDSKTIIQVSSNFWLTIHVLYTFTQPRDAEGPFKPLYAEVVNEFGSWVNFVKEDNTVD
jgi:hypothetical protein